MLHARVPATETAGPRTELEVDTGISEDVASPAVVIPREHRHGKSRIAQIHQCGQRTDAGAGNHALPLEPELEQVAVDQQRRRTSGQGAKEGDEQSLDVRRRVTEVYVGDDVT